MSMTKEEAFKKYEEWRNLGFGHSTMPPSEVLVMAMNSLRPITRERLEKVFPRCDFCKIELDDYPYIVARGDYDSSDTCYELSFCPICGKPLTDKAVDMVMERLEALYEET